MSYNTHEYRTFVADNSVAHSRRILSHQLVPQLFATRLPCASISQFYLKNHAACCFEWWVARWIITFRSRFSRSSIPPIDHSLPHTFPVHISIASCYNAPDRALLSVLSTFPNTLLSRLYVVRSCSFILTSSLSDSLESRRATVLICIYHFFAAV